MTIEKFFIADPYNDEHLSMYEDFESKNNITTRTTALFNDIRNKYTEEEYLEISKKDNEIKQSLFSTVDSKISDSCFIHGVKDMKTCSIFFSPIDNKNRTLLSFATDYALNVLNMEEVFVPVDKTNHNLQNLLEAKGYENLGEEGNFIEFVKEKEMENEPKVGRTI